MKATTRAGWQHARHDIKIALSWNRLYRATSYLRSALWIVPFIAIVLILITAPLLRGLDSWLAWNITDLAPDGAQALFQAITTLTLSFLVFTFGSLLVAIQVASVQLTPRIIATTLLRNNVVRYSVGLFVFTLIFSISALNHQGTTVNQFIAVVGAVLGITCIAAFLFLIDYAARLLRPVSILAHVGNEGLAVIEAVYPDSTSRESDIDRVAYEPTGPPQRLVRHEGSSGIVLAVDLATLVEVGRRAEGLIEFVPQVGDFVASGEPLFALYGGTSAIGDGKLHATVVFGSERTMEQDPLFAFRILVDIALKALSPAINDPTTAVLALDQIHCLLRALGKRHLRGAAVADQTGRRRVIFRTPNWEDFVHISCNEIRACGAGSVQIARRMRALLDNLVSSLPEHRHAALRQEVDLLDRTLPRFYALPEDLALARIADTQGLGAPSRAPGRPD